MRLRFVMLLCMLASGPCDAQTFAPSSDVDLLAAYCFGVVARSLASANEFRAKFDGSNAPADVQVAVQMGKQVQELQNRHQRLRSYIVPKIQYLDPTSLAAARARGDSDYSLVQALAGAALEECHRSGGNDLVQCVQTKVQTNGARQRMDRCDRLDFLPF